VNGRAPLFDARARDDAAYVRFDETTYRFLDRVDDVFFARVRDLLNQWFAESADDETAERLRRDFASERDEQVDGAFWELYLHAALIRTPLEVELEPGRERGRQPDFRGWPPAREEQDFFLEARAIGDPPAARAKQRRLQQAWDSVNAAAPAGFMVHMRRVTPGKQNPSGVRLRNEIVPWLQSLDRAALRAAVEECSGRKRYASSARTPTASWSRSPSAAATASSVTSTHASRRSCTPCGWCPGRSPTSCRSYG
jgi:hypothetical protein